MITPAEFPYITSIHVNDCYTYQDFDINLVKHQPFSHLILTGKNGSGKSTILREIHKLLISIFNGSYHPNTHSNNKVSLTLTGQVARLNKDILFFRKEKVKIIFTLFSPNRKSSVGEVKSPTTQNEFEKYLGNATLSSDYYINNFKQFLVNEKVNQAFAQLDNNEVEIQKIDTFFNQIESVLRLILGDSDLKLTFKKESYEFFIELSDGRKLTFNVLPDGFSAFLSILMDLFTRLDLIRKSVGNFTYDPCGIVLIDEPETHLHLSLQYQVLPILTKLFPNVQFIVATHSPAVISSIKNVTVFDLTSKETMSDEAVGKSFSELMVSHFGLDNEFSSITDEIFDEFNAVLRSTRNDINLRKEKLRQLMQKHEQYISPTMRFELEAKLSE